MNIIKTIRIAWCQHCGIRALVIDRDFTLIDDHRRHVHRARKARSRR